MYKKRFFSFVFFFTVSIFFGSFSNSSLAADCTSDTGKIGICTDSASNITCPTGKALAVSIAPCPNSGHCCVDTTAGTGTQCQSSQGTCVSNSISGGSACPSPTIPVSSVNDCPAFNSCCMTTEQEEALLPPVTGTPTAPETPLEICRSNCYATGQVTQANTNISDCLRSCDATYPTNNTFSSTDSSTGGGGLIPCGHGSNPADACTLCDFIVGFKRLIDFGSEILITITVVGVLVSGVMYIISAGDEQLITKAKNFLSSSLIGFTIVLTAWLLINVTMWALSYNTDLSIGKSNWYTFDCVK